MSDRHIEFSKLEEDEAFDISHLAACSACQRKEKIFRFLRFQAERTPEFEPPLFFASRMARRVQTENPRFVVLLEQMARRLVVLFATLIVITSVLLYKVDWETKLDLQSEVLFESPPEVPLSLEYVVNSLTQPAEEGIVEEP